MAQIEDFHQLDIRIGKVLNCIPFEKARKPAYKLEIDFGNDIGIKKSSAQITDFYQPGDLIGKQIVAIINFPPRQIANFISEVLVLGSVSKNGKVTLLIPEREVENGEKIA